MDDPLVNDIIGFLERPVLMSQVAWNPTQAARTTLDYFNFPADYVANPMIKQKLAGFYGIRADVVVRVQVNANPFQQGRLIMTYVPMFTEFYAAQANRANLMYSSLNYITQLPRAELDLGSTTEMVLRMPYVTTDLYTNLTTMEPSFGRYSLAVYSPLFEGAVSTPVDVTVWAHLENVKLFYPTQAYAQSSFAAPKPNRKRGTKNKKDTRQVELESVRLGPISSVSNLISNVASALMPVPFLSDICAPIKWVADIVTGTASAFGWSKPTTEGSANAIQLHTMYRMTNSDGVDTSQKLSLLTTNQVAPLPGFAGSDLDELDIRRIACQFAFLGAYEWNSKSKLIASLLTNVATYNIQMNNVTDTLLSTPCSYVANMFALNRTSIDYKFKFIKTKFHSGRLVFVFMPGMTTPPPFYDSAMDYSYKVVLDIRESDEVVVRVPYVNTRPYQRVNEHNGCIGVYVLNALVCPTDVSQSVQMIMEVACGPDCEFAEPMPLFQPTLNLIQPKNGQMRAFPPKKYDHDVTNDAALGSYEIEPLPLESPPPKVHFQAGEFSGEQDTVEPTSIDGNATTAVYEPAKFCIGERIVSFRQLIKRFSRYGAWNPWTPNLPLLVFPYYLNMGVVTSTPHYYDWLDYISPMFLLHRGSIRLKVRMNGAETYTANLCTPSQGFNRTNYQTALPATAAAEVLISHSLAGAVEVEVPQYHFTHSYMMVADTIGTGTTGEYLNHNVVAVSTDAPKDVVPYIYRAAGDDFSSGFFYGTLNMFLQ